MGYSFNPFTGTFDNTGSGGTTGTSTGVVFVWKFDTGTTQPGLASGDLRYNNATPASVTALYISETSDNGADLSAIIAQLSAGARLYIQQADDSTKFLLVSVVSTVDNGTDWTINVTVDDSGVLPDNNKELGVVALGANQVPSMTAGSVVFHNGTTLAQDNATFFWDSTNKRLGIGVGASENTVTINGITFGNTLSIHAEGASDLGNFSIHRHSAVGVVSANMQLIRSRGTEAAETIVSADDRLGGIFASGHNGVDYSDSSAMVFEVDGTPGNNDMPGRIIFYTSPDGSETLTEALRISSNQRVTFANGPAITGFTAGSVLFYDGTKITEDTAGLAYDNTKNALVVNETAAWAAAGTSLFFTGIVYPKNITVSTATEDRNFAAYRFSSTGAPTNLMLRARGTSGALLDIVSGDVVGRLANYGYYSGSYAQASQITFGTEGTLGAGAVPGTILFQTANSGGTLTTALTISSAQICTFANQPVGIAFSGLSDVTLTSPANGDTLRYNSSTSRWNNSTRLKVTDQVSVEPATPAATFPYAIVADHAGTNLIVNPSFENNITDGWSATGVSTNTRDTTQKWIGSASLKIVTSATNGGVISSAMTITSSTQYVVSFYVKGAVGGEGVKLIITPNVGSAVNNYSAAGFQVQNAVNTEWSRMTMAWTSGASDTSVQISIVSALATAGQTIYIDAVQFEAKTYPTDVNEVAIPSSYMDGSMGDGYAWTGTAHNSTSTRTAGTKFLAPISSTNNRGNFVMRTDGTIGRFTADAKEIQIADLNGSRVEPFFPFNFIGDMKTNVNVGGVLAGIVNVRNLGNGTALHIQSQATTAEGLIVSADAITTGSCMSVFAPADLSAMQAAGGKFFTFSGKAQNADMYSFYVDKVSFGQLGFLFQKNFHMIGGGSMTATTRALAGTLSVTNGSATVTGAGTAFLTDFKRGQAIVINNGGATNVNYTIASIASNTSLTLTIVYAGTTNAARTYSSFTTQYRPPVLHLEGAYANHGGGLVSDYYYGIYASGGNGQLHVKKSASLGTSTTPLSGVAPSADHDGHGLVTARQVSVDSGLIFGSAAETTMISGYTIPAYELTLGGAFRISFVGTITGVASTSTITWRVKLGGTTILTSTAVQVGLAGGAIHYRGVIEIWALSNTTQTTSISITGKDIASVAPGLTYSVNEVDTTGAVDMRIDQALTITAQFDAIGSVLAVDGATTEIL